MEHYVYRHIRLDTGHPFYVGLGTKPKKYGGYRSEYSRAHAADGRNLHWKRIVAKHGYEVEILYETEDYVEAQAKEIEFIALHKRTKNGGSLVNLTDGGEGTTGMILSDEAKRKMSLAKVGRKLTPEHVAKMVASISGSNNVHWGKKGALNHRSITVYAYSCDGEFIREYGSTREASRELQVSPSSIIYGCQGRSKIKGFVLSYNLLK